MATAGVMLNTQKHCMR